MSRLEQGPKGRLAWLVPAAWVAMPLLLMAYVVLRYVSEAPGGIALAQVVYLSPPTLAVALAVGAAWAASPRTRARAVWILVSAAVILLFMSESYYAWDRLLDQASSASGLLFDAVNVAVFAVMVAMLTFVGSIDRLGSRRMMRLTLDTGALMVLGFVVVFRLLVALLGPDIDVPEAARMTAYSLSGVLLLVMTSYVSLSIPAERRRPWTTILAWGIALYAAAMLLWPFWSLSVIDRRPSVAMEALFATLFLSSCYLIFMAGLYRVVSPEETWGQAYSEPTTQPAAWQGVAISVLVMLSAAALGLSACYSPDGSRTQLVFLGSLCVATACLVSRTALASLEADEMRARGFTDPVTGAPNPKSFDEKIEAHFAANRRFGESFALILLDLDDFARVNEAMSLSAGDRVLTDVVVAVGQVIGGADAVFRMSSDEFAALVPVSSRHDAENIAGVVGRAIQTIPVPGGPLTASIGFALCPDDALQRDALVSRADGALAWAKHHGRGRVIGYDQRVEQALGDDERMRMLEQDTKMGVARALMAAADARDPRNHFHSRSVAALACLLASDLGFEPEHVERVRMASMLHDVGKIALASPVADGPRERPREKQESREHSELGEKMLNSLAMPDVSQWVRAHHERWDGRGYPDGLKATKIPLEARIIALANAYDAMTGGDRPGGPLSKAAALQEIDQSMGTRFDPALAERFIRVVATTSALGWSDDWSAA